MKYLLDANKLTIFPEILVGWENCKIRVANLVYCGGFFCLLYGGFRGAPVMRGCIFTVIGCVKRRVLHNGTEMFWANRATVTYIFTGEADKIRDCRTI